MTEEWALPIKKCPDCNGFKLELDRINITTEQLVDLSEEDNITAFCKHCSSIRTMHPISQIAGNRPTVFLVEDEDLRKRLAEIPDYQDSFIVACDTCGTYCIAVWSNVTTEMEVR